LTDLRCLHRLTDRQDPACMKCGDGYQVQRAGPGRDRRMCFAVQETHGCCPQPNHGSIPAPLPCARRTSTKVVTMATLWTGTVAALRARCRTFHRPRRSRRRRRRRHRIETTTATMTSASVAAAASLFKLPRSNRLSSAVVQVAAEPHGSSPRAPVMLRSPHALPLPLCCPFHPLSSHSTLYCPVRDLG
jgi:hypothetical protein